MIRPTATDIICEAFQTERADRATNDGKPMSSHVHLLSVVRVIRDAFTAEGIDLEALVDEAIAAQTVTIR